MEGDLLSLLSLHFIGGLFLPEVARECDKIALTVESISTDLNFFSLRPFP